jgi:hypothetical protein
MGGSLFRSIILSLSYSYNISCTRNAPYCSEHLAAVVLWHHTYVHGEISASGRYTHRTTRQHSRPTQPNTCHPAFRLGGAQCKRMRGCNIGEDGGMECEDARGWRDGGRNIGEHTREARWSHLHAKIVDHPRARTEHVPAGAKMC